MPPKYDKAAPFVYDRRVPQLAGRPGRGSRSPAARSRVGDQFFRPQRTDRARRPAAHVELRGAEPHSVTVANGPRGFSSNYLGNVGGAYSFTPTVPGTYRLTCLIHPTTMSQTVKCQTRLEEVQAQVVEPLLGLDVELRSSPVNSSRPITISTTPESAVMIR